MLSVSATPAALAALLDRGASLPVLARLALGIAVTLTTWDNRRRSRHALAKLDPQQLADIGITPEAALREASLPFWRA